MILVVVELRKMEVEVIPLAERVRPDVRGGKAAATVARDEVSDDSTATHS